MITRKNAALFSFYFVALIVANVSAYGYVTGDKLFMWILASNGGHEMAPKILPSVIRYLSLWQILARSLWIVAIVVACYGMAVDQFKRPIGAILIVVVIANWLIGPY